MFVTDLRLSVRSLRGFVAGLCGGGAGPGLHRPGEQLELLALPHDPALGGHRDL